jgi:acyl-CoA synthetase (AMP-forming)/AMP-acid ligase II
MLFRELLHQTAGKFSEHEAVVHKSQRTSYGQIWAESLQLGHYLDRELKLLPGDRVVVLLENSVRYITSYFGIIGAGGIVVPLNPDTTAHELRAILQDCGPKGLLCHSSILSTIEDVLEEVLELEFILVEGEETRESGRIGKRVEPWIHCLQNPAQEWEPYSADSDSVAQIIYTSGTTGRPKGVMLSHGSLLANTDSIVTYLGLQESDRVQVILPFFYSYGNSLLLTHFRVGGTLVLADQFVFLQSIVSQMIREKVTGFSGVPSSFAMLERHSKFFVTPLESLRYVTCAGGALPTTMIGRLQEAFPDTDIVIMYGQTEASARLSYLPPEELPQKLGSIGKGIPNVTLSVLNEEGQPVGLGEVGEIVAEGSCLMKGYWHNEEETQRVLKEGRLHTGDLATRDEDGFIFIVGRQSDTIKYGSYRIHPSQIEEVLSTCPGVEQIAVTGFPDETVGEIIVASIVPSPGHELSPTDLLQYAKQFLPTYKLPQRVVFVEDLPKTSSGKIKRAQLRDMVGAAL